MNASVTSVATTAVMTFAAAALLGGLTACADKPQQDPSVESSGLANPQPAGKAIAVSLAEGTAFTATLVDPIASAVDKMGGTVTALVSGDVKDPSGRPVIASGSMLSLRIDDIDGVTSVRPRGMIRLSPRSILIQGAEIAIKARVDSVPYRLVERMLLVERATQLTVTLTAPLVVSLVP